MSEPEKEKLAELAQEAKNDDTFEKLDEMEKDLNLDEEPITDPEEDEENPEKKSPIEKIIEDTPAIGLMQQNNSNPN